MRFAKLALVSLMLSWFTLCTTAAIISTTDIAKRNIPSFPHGHPVPKWWNNYLRSFYRAYMHPIVVGNRISQSRFSFFKARIHILELIRR